MCFSEFVGYTCGHTSPEVLRPCPMTTQSHTNPVCSSHGRRPILVAEMCPACQRILHGRAVMIIEWEHHWMHERGVCGCPVVFPDLIRPRVMGRGQPFEDADQLESAAKERESNGKGRNKSNRKTQTPHSLISSQNHSQAHTAAHTTRAAPTTTHPPVSHPTTLPKKPDTSNTFRPKKNQTGRQETSRINDLKETKPVAGVPVQISSFYGAEWVDEHRNLHNAGSCKCEGDFSFYKTPETYRNSSSSRYNGRVQAVHTTSSYPAPGQASVGTSTSAYMNGQASSHDPRTFSTSSYRHHNSTIPGAQRPSGSGSYPGGLRGLHQAFQSQTQSGSQYEQVSTYVPRPILA